MKRFLSIIIGSVFILGTVLHAMNYWYDRKVDTYNTMKFKQMGNEIKICNTGSSHGLYGICYDRIEAEGIPCVNMALSAQPLLYDERLLEYYQSHLAEGAVVIIVVSPFSIFGTSDEEAKKQASINERYYGILPADMVTPYDPSLAVLNKWPVLTAYDKLFKAVIGKTAENRLKWETLAVDAEKLEEQATEKYMAHFEARRNENGEIRHDPEREEVLENMLGLCKEKGYEAILITPPFTKEYNEICRDKGGDFLDGFYEKMSELSIKYGVNYYDYSKDERFVEDSTLFMDCDHLNKTGALKFTDILRNEVFAEE